MKKSTIITTLSFILILFFATSCGSNKSENENIQTEQTENTRYQCPMKCEGEKTYDEPGKCPVCNMNLERVEPDMDGHKNADHNH